MKLADIMLQELADARGVSGHEGEVRKIIRNAIKDHVDEIRIDAMGSLLATKRGTGKSDMRVLVAAHMDEVGFMVTGYDSNGTLQIRNVGGIDARILPALRVEVGKDALPGVITWKPIHLNREKSVKGISDMRVDIGVDSKDSAKGKAKLGDQVTFMAKTEALSDTVIRGKAFDDRVGCALLVELLKGEPMPFDIIAAFTVQEEVGLRGATVLAEAVDPTAALVLETTASHQMPQDIDEPDFTTVTRLGEGPAISLMDRTSIAHPGLVRHFKNTAAKYDIPHQFRSPQFAGGTDAGVIHMSRAGIPAITMSVPCRYIHSPYSILNLNDFEHALQLARHALMDLTPESLKR